jgi:hypothetical protein
MFHGNAGTLTSAVGETLEALEQGQRCIRVSHQPNFAAYLKLVALFVATDVLAERTGYAPIYIVNDCDVVTNERFSRALLPDFTHPAGHRYLRLRLLGLPSATLAQLAPRPPETWLRETGARIIENFATELRLSRRVRSLDGQLEVEVILADLEYAWHNSQTMSQMTSIFLSRLANLRLALGIVFIPGSAVWREVGPQVVEYLFEHWEAMRAGQRLAAVTVASAGIEDFRTSWLIDRRLAPIWWACSCASRVRLDVAQDMSCFGVCRYCGEAVRLEKRRLSAETEMGRVLPRVGALNLAESMSSDLAFGVSYMSSCTHSLVYSLVAREMNIPVLPQIFLDARGNFSTPVEIISEWRRPPKSAIGIGGAAAVVSQGRASIIYYLSRVKPEDLKTAIQNWAVSGDFDEPLRMTW